MANIVITGANRGIGLALARVYAARAEDRLFACCRDPGSADALKALAAASGGRVQIVAMEVGDGASIDAAAAAIGDVPVDVLLNVAGIYRAESGPEDRNFDGWRESFEVMVIGPFRVTQALLPNLRAAKGRVMTVTSQIGASVWPHGGLYSYGGTKAAVNRVMKSLSIDLAPEGIAVGLVHPGHVKTDMGGPDAAITPEDSAAGIAAVVDGLSVASTGSFHNWNGTPHAW